VFHHVGQSFDPQHVDNGAPGLKRQCDGVPIGLSFAPPNGLALIVAALGPVIPAGSRATVRDKSF
jgi:hypothetical protein